MIDKLALLHPEIALFITTCVVMILGLSKGAYFRKSAALVTALGLGVAAVLGAMSPTGRESGGGLADAILPNWLPYTKTLIAVVGLLLLPLLTGVVDRLYERDIEKGAGFNPIRATRGEFYAFFLFSMTGVMLCATADDLIWIFLALELTSLPTYIMVAMSSGRLRSQEAGVKYFFLGALGAAIFLYGFALIYGATGTTMLPEIRASLAASGGNMIATVGFILALVGVSFKIAAVPMHFYTPDVYQGAAAPVSAYLAFAPKVAGFLVIILLVATLGWTHGPAGTSLPAEIRVLLWVMAAMTMTVGNVLAFLQTNVKRMLAYSSIAHSGYILVGVIAGPGTGSIASNGIAAALFYLLVYGVMNLGAFAVLASLERRVGPDEFEEIETLEDIKGLCRTYPLLGWVMVICALSLLGMPPLLGFFGKLMLFTSAISAGEIVLVVILGLNSAIAAFYYLKLAAFPLLEPSDPLLERPTLTPSSARRWAAFASAAGVVVLIIFISPLQQASSDAAAVSAGPEWAAEDIAPDPGDLARIECISDSSWRTDSDLRKRTAPAS